MGKAEEWNSIDDMHKEWNIIESIKERMKSSEEVLVICMAFRLAVLKVVEQDIIVVKTELDDYKADICTQIDELEEKGEQIAAEIEKKYKWIYSEGVKQFEEIRVEDLDGLREQIMYEAGILLASQKDSRKTFKLLEQMVDNINVILVVAPNWVESIVEEIGIIMNLEEKINSRGELLNKLALKKALLKTEESILEELLVETQAAIENTWATWYD